MSRLLVLGGGPAGLAAAWLTARQGHDVELIERAPHLGGMAASFDVAGVRVDHGSHRLHRATPPRVLGELQRLLGDDLQLRQRHGRLRLEGHWLDFPLQAPDLARHLPPGLAVELARDVIAAPWRAPADDSFAALVTAGLGPTVANRFYLPYARKLFGVPVEELDGELARRRVPSRTATSIIKRLGGRRGSAGRTFFYPRHGFGQIPQALAEAAAAAGVALRTGADVTAIDLRPDGVTVHLTGGGRVDGDRLWSTIPTTALARLAGEPVDGAGLRYRAMALVYLALDQPRYTAFDAHYLPDPSHPVSRLSEPKNYRDGPDPSGRTVLCAEVPCDQGDDVWCAGADALAALVEDALAGEQLPPARPVDVAVRRLPTVYPVYRRGWAAQQDALEAWAARHERLLVLGRQALFAHDNTHHALTMAWAAAACLRTDGSFDRDRWDGEREDFRAHVVVD
ncbi:MAG TPA: FAD-dependent oxidoreductase [Acidimicrobiales bacterium]